MIEQGGIILKASTWCNDELAVPGGDLVLAAFVNLRIISAEMLQLASPSRPLSNRSHGEILSKILNNGITAWEQDWLPLFEDSLFRILPYLIRYTDQIRRFNCSMSSLSR
jgi:hypothetical protein